MMRYALFKIDQIVIPMVRVGAWHTNAHLARLTIKSNLLVGVLFAHDVFFDFQLVNTMIDCYFHLLMCNYTRSTHELLAFDAFRCGFFFFLVDYFANVASSHFGRTFRQQQLVQTAYQKVIV
jgi:hypothetical protein